jgi:cyclopropane fatty-acyl-phospholipid synthase-like methyltransferase
MTTHEKNTFDKVYSYADHFSKLPWAHEHPSRFLDQIAAIQETGTVLDIGCGGGTDSVFMASQGWDVTSLDFVGKALEMTQARAIDAGFSVKTVEADITVWEPIGEFDLVLDHGLLHNMDPVRYKDYRQRVMQSIRPGGHFVILHWLQRNSDELQSELGPTRASRETINDFFAPELVERKFDFEEYDGLPDSVGGSMAQAYYWFVREGNE